MLEKRRGKDAYIATCSMVILTESSDLRFALGTPPGPNAFWRGEGQDVFNEAPGVPVRWRFSLSVRTCYDLHLTDKPITALQPLPVSTSPVREPTQRGRLRALIDMVKLAATAKGWSAEIVAQDKKEYRYATVAVRRTMQASFEDVTGTFEITCDQRIKITYHQTSFHGYGLSDLYDAVANEFWKLPWVTKKEVASEGKSSDTSTAHIGILESLLRRFHAVARQLKHRHESRGTLAITDEYDVQDLLHASSMTSDPKSIRRAMQGVLQGSTFY
ncbi:MAG: hypothetical protein JWO48_553 [Bryobacterales bacterium]|nr:hypothetical protein [Bryobacterales bacterium]